MSYAIGQDASTAILGRDEQIEVFFSQGADISAMLEFERALVLTQSEQGFVPESSARKILNLLDGFTVDFLRLREDFKNDGVIPPSLVRQCRQKLNQDDWAYFHYGVTSQDLIDSSLMMRLKLCVTLCGERLGKLDRQLQFLSDNSSLELRLSARTRMQNALPLSPQEKIGNWRVPLFRLQDSLPQSFPLQLGGAEGAARIFGETYEKIVADVAEKLHLEAPKHHWQTDRQPLTSIAFWFSQVASSMGKIALDILFMTQTDVAEAKLMGGGSSSAMPHKQNPVIAEMIVAQSRYCQTQMNGLNTASLHENERSGSAWTLEWMLFPPLVVVAANSISLTLEMLERLRFIPKEETPVSE